MTILFFDERFNLISVSDGGVWQEQVASSWSTTTLPLTGTVQAPKNGYAFVYVSNRSDQAVYFDNLAIGIQAGNIIEEDHYYSFGLKIAGISSKKLGDCGEGTLKNNYLYNDKELFDDGGLNWYDYGFRNYDPQIGRFTQLDPLTDDYPFLTPYQYASDDPIANVDIDGLEGGVVTGGLGTTAATAKVLTQVVVTPLRAASTTASVISTFKEVVSFTNLLAKTAEIASNVISRGNSQPAGGGGPKYQAYLKLVATRGALDAIANANTIGLYDLFGGNHVDEYQTDEEREAYYQGRLAGDAFSAAQGGSEMEAGVTGGMASGVETAGIGLAAGGVVALHGAGTAAVANNDAARSAAALIKLGLVLKASSSHPPPSQVNNNVETTSNKNKYVRDYQSKNTKPSSAWYKSEREARTLAKTKLGRDAVEVEPGKWRSADGKWQYRAKDDDVLQKHIHIEELDPKTGEVLQNIHLRWK